MSKLEFRSLRRLGETNVGSFRSSRTFRQHLDFVVDGESLYDLTRAADHDFIGLLGWAGFEQDARSVRELLLETPSESPTGRQSIFVCAECGDLGCGAITANVSRIGDRYVWKDFAYENNYDEAMTDREPFIHVGPYEFDAATYREVMNSVLFGAGY